MKKELIVRIAFSILFLSGAAAISPVWSGSHSIVTLGNIHTDHVAVIAGAPKPCPGPWFVEAVD